MAQITACEWKLIGSVGVDSGTIAIVDPCYANRLGKDDVAWSDDGSVALSAIVGTGCGDGSFPVYARTNENGCKEIRIVCEHFERNEFPETLEDYRCGMLLR